MIAKWYQSASAVAAERAREDVRHADGEARRAAGAREQRALADLVARASAIWSGVTGKPQLDDRGRRRDGVGADHAGGAVDREVDARLQRRGGDHRHDGDERLEQHAAVADHRRVGLLAQQLRRGAGRDQRVEAGDRAAGDRDEAEREDLAGEDRAGAVDEARQRPAAGSSGSMTTMPTASARDRAELDERREIVARREQQPDRQHRRGEAVDDDRPGERRARSG